MKATMYRVCSTEASFRQSCRDALSHPELDFVVRVNLCQVVDGSKRVVILNAYIGVAPLNEGPTGQLSSATTLPGTWVTCTLQQWSSIMTGQESANVWSSHLKRASR